MREIKFRGHDGSDWIYGSAVSHDKCTDTWYMIEEGAPDDDWVMVGEVGQFTGLRDSKDRDIYEGDIVSYDQRNLDQALGGENGPDYLYKVRTISYMEQGFNVPQGFIKNLKVVGNCYEK